LSGFSINAKSVARLLLTGRRLAFPWPGEQHCDEPGPFLDRQAQQRCSKRFQSARVIVFRRAGKHWCKRRVLAT